MNKVYIELGEAINAIKSSRGNCDHRFYDEGLMDACSEIIGLKPADVAPVQHGEWKTDRFGLERSICSLCNACYEGDGGKFCPNCGARMDGGKK